VYQMAVGIANRIHDQQGTLGTATDNIVTRLATEAADHAIGPWTRQVSSAIASNLPVGELGREGARAVVSATISAAVVEGGSSVIHWAIGA
jgi:hypothetical protein